MWEGWLEPRLLFDLLQFVLTAGVGVYVWLGRRHQATKNEIEKVAAVADEKVRRGHERIDSLRADEANLRDRVSKLEQAVADAPTGKAVHELAISITQFGGELKALTTQLQGIEKVVERQERVTTRLEDWMRKVETR